MKTNVLSNYNRIIQKNLYRKFYRFSCSIICPHCGKDTGMTKEQFMFYIITNDIKCPHCRNVIFKAKKIIY